MRSSYRPIGDYIELVDERNLDLKVSTLLGLSISKQFIPSVANTVGTNMRNYKIIRKNQFACSTMQVRRDRKMPVALLQDFEEAIISQAYPVFEIIDTKKLLPQYLMMWFSRDEFDRYAEFLAVGGVRGTLEWEDFLTMELPVPSLEKQQEIVNEYNVITERIKLNKQLNQKLEETAQALYKHWFVDFEFPDENGEFYKSSGGAMVYNEELDKEIPEEWVVTSLETLSNLKYGKMLNAEKFLDKGYPVFSGYGIRGYYSKYMYEYPQILVLCRGVSGTGEVRMSPPKAYITNLSIVVENDNLKISKDYLFHFLKDSELRSLDSGSAQSQITIGDLNRVPILVPNHKLLDRFGIIKGIIDEEQAMLRRQNTKLISLKYLLLSKMAKAEIDEVLIN